MGEPTIPRHAQAGTGPLIGAVVLAGGASRRMGTDKAQLEVDGQRLVDRAVDAAVSVANGGVVVAGPDPGALRSGVICVADPVGPRQGPMAGLLSGWRHLSTQLELENRRLERLVVLSCDLPSIDADVVVRLVAASTDGAEAMAHDGERPQPLVAVYQRETIERLSELFAVGERSIRRAIDPASVVNVPIDGDRATDADTPSDLAARAVRWPTQAK